MSKVLLFKTQKFINTKKGTKVDVIIMEAESRLESSKGVFAAQNHQLQFNSSELMSFARYFHCLISSIVIIQSSLELKTAPPAGKHSEIMCALLNIMG
jgi:hypothetical protein